MQEQITFQVSANFLSQSSPNLNLLKKELSQNLKSVEQLLVNYHYQSRGRVFDVTVQDTSVEFISDLMAKFVVNYSIGQFNACADLDFSERASMEMLVDFEAEKKIAIITGEYIPERDPDEF